MNNEQYNLMIDAYNISFMLMDKWRKYAMQSSGSIEKLGQVPVFVEHNGELLEVTDVVDENGKIILKTK
jgi:hypothetical protein